METRKRLTVSGILILGVVITLALAAGLTLAQGSKPEMHIDEPLGPEEIAAVGSVIPIQGRLTDDDGNPLTGSYSIYAALYAAGSGGTALCSDTDTVTVDKGLFTMYIDGADGCSSADIDGKQLYLGIKVGSDPEMTPRQGIYPVPYAYSLRPGAEISGTTSGAIVHVENWSASGRGLRVYAMSETGTNYGVVGASRSPDGYGGYFYNNGGGTGVWGDSTDGYGVYGESTSSNGVRGVSASNYGVVGRSTSNAGIYGHSTSDFGVYGLSDGSSGVYGLSAGSYVATTAGVRGDATDNYGVYGSSSNNNGVYGNTNRTDRNYGLYTLDNLYSLNVHLAGATMQIVQNSGKMPLEIGDVVAFSGIGAPLEADGAPIIQVAGAESANSTAVAGVVYSRYNIEALSADPEKVVADITPEGAVTPGEYLLIVVQGPAQVKASAINGALQPGDLLSSAGQTGYAAQATTVTLSGMETAIPGTVLGKVLEPLDKGEALIYIFVTLQ